jgi:Fe-S cluster biosynthesis and repair protein YggX
MLINENRLNPLDPAARKYLAEQMEKFLFGGDVDRATGYTPPDAQS